MHKLSKYAMTNSFLSSSCTPLLSFDSTDRQIFFWKFFLTWRNLSRVLHRFTLLESPNSPNSNYVILVHSFMKRTQIKNVDRVDCTVWLSVGSKSQNPKFKYMSLMNELLFPVVFFSLGFTHVCTNKCPDLWGLLM